MNKPKLLFIVPGANGDQFVCAPIAKYYYDQGYEVIWPTGKRFSQVPKRLDYVTHVLMDDSEVLHSDWLRSDVMKIKKMEIYKTADKIIDLADRGDVTLQWIGRENFEMTKWRLAGLDFELKHNLTWPRDFKKEQELVDLLCPAGPYVFAALSSSHGEVAEMPKQDLSVVVAREIPGFEIWDWASVILGAETCYATESSFFCFIDGFVHQLKNKPYVLRRASSRSGERDVVAKYWDHRYIGETTLRG